MARPKSLKPKHCKHPSGRGYVRIDGRFRYTGTWGTQAAQDAYDRIIGEWIATGRLSLPNASTGEEDAEAGPTVSHVLAAFWLHARAFYVNPDGSPTGEADNFKHAMRPLRRLYGRAPAGAFGPMKLRVVRDEMIRVGWCRTLVNRQVSRIRQIFKWATAQELLSPTVYQGLSTLEPLRAGRSAARESEPVDPVDEDHVEQTLRFLSPQVWAMVRLQLLTGMRPGEVFRMRTGDVDRTGAVWVYTPATHKTAHHGHARQILIGPQAQEVLSPFLKLDPKAFCFSPAEAAADRRAERTANRRTPANQGNSVGSRVVRKRRRAPGDCYDKNSYRRAVVRAADKANSWAKGGMIVENETRVIPRWHPHQLRHTAATKLRREFGLEAAQVILGHKTLSVTEVYAAKNVAAAREIMARVG